MKATLVIAGLAIFLLSLYSAFVLNFKHFYEFELLGLLLLLYPLVPSTTFGAFRQISYLYANFVFAGFVVDYIIGQQLTGMWSYTYTATWEYALLYLWIYPAGGFVLLQSYLIGKRMARAGQEKSLSIQTLYALCLASIFVLVGLWFSEGLLPYIWWAGSLVGILALLGCITVDLLSEWLGGQSYARDLVSNPVSIGLVTIVATYLNLLIHEVPNVYARQWTYLSDPQALLGIPLVVWLLWPLLLIGPVVLYCLVKARAG